MENDQIRVGTPLRNNLGYNRYFIIDYVNININSESSYASYYTQERVREFSISSKEIRDIISGSAKLFAQMIKVTVGEKEDAKIYAAYDKVDEKTLITAVIGFPVVVVGAVEALPLLYAAGQASLPTLGKAFAVNSGKFAAINGGMEFSGQYLSSGLVENDWSLNKIDWIDVGSNAAFSKGGEIILGSAMDFSFQYGFKHHADEKLAENLLLSYGTGKLNSKIDFGFDSVAGQYSSTLSKFLSNSVQLNINVMINSAKHLSEKKDNE